MSELRYDPLFGQWVNIAAIRAERPNEFRRVESRRAEAVCPFCAGQEFRTPPTILELVGDDASRSTPRETAAFPWLVRVVPNKYPAFTPATERKLQSAGPYTCLRGGGLHEIVVESPRHVISLSELSDEELGLSFRAYQLRILAALELADVRQVTLFKNCRAEAGASVEHIHAQLIASPVLSDTLAARFERCARAHHDTGVSLLESMIRFEAQEECRLLESRGDFVAFCPYASRFAYQIWIAAQSSGEVFERLSRVQLDELSRLVRSCVARLERSFDGVPYNMLLHLPPPRIAHASAAEIFPWFIELIPRLSRWAGFELADGGWISDCLPEFAAAKLRGDSVS